MVWCVVFSVFSVVGFFCLLFCVGWIGGALALVVVAMLFGVLWGVLYLSCVCIVYLFWGWSGFLVFGCLFWFVFGLLCACCCGNCFLVLFIDVIST